MAKLGYGPKTISLDQLKIGEASGVTMEGAGSFDRVNATGKLALNASAASLGQITGADRAAGAGAGVAAQCDGSGSGPGAAQADARSRQEFRACRSRQCARRARPRRAAAQGRRHDHGEARARGAARRSISMRSGAAKSASNRNCRRSSGGALLALLGLDRAIAAGDGPAQFEGSATGVWRAPLRLKAKLSGAGLDADAQGTAEPWAAEPKASVNLKVRSVNLAPLFDLKPSDALAQNISLSSRVSLAGNKLTFDDLDSAIVGLAAARAHGVDARRRKERRGRDRPRHARSRAGLCARHRQRGARCRRAARRRAVEGLARPHRVSGAARHAAGRRRVAPGQRHRQERRPIADLRRHQGRHRRRRGDRQYRRQAGRERNCAQCARSARRRRWRGVALSRAGDAGGPRVDADDAGEPGPQRVGADRRVVRKRNRDAGIRRASPGSIRAPSMSRSAPAMAGRRPTTSSCGRSSSRCCRPARCRSRRRKFRSTSGTAGFASARPRSMPTARAPSYRADTIFPPTRPTFAPIWLRRRRDPRPAVRKFSCSRWARPMRSIAPSMWRRCRHGWRCGRSIAKPAGWIRSSAANRRRRCRPRFRRRRPRRRRPQRRRGAASDGRRPTRSAPVAPKPKVVAPRPPVRRRSPMRLLSASRWRRCRRRSRSARSRRRARPPKPRPPLVLTPPAANPPPRPSVLAHRADQAESHRVRIPHSLGLAALNPVRRPSRGCGNNPARTGGSRKTDCLAGGCCRSRPPVRTASCRASPEISFMPFQNASSRLTLVL